MIYPLWRGHGAVSVPTQTALCSIALGRERRATESAAQPWNAYTGRQHSNKCIFIGRFPSQIKIFNLSPKRNRVTCKIQLFQGQKRGLGILRLGNSPKVTQLNSSVLSFWFVFAILGIDWIYFSTYIKKWNAPRCFNRQCLKLQHFTEQRLTCQSSFKNLLVVSVRLKHSWDGNLSFRKIGMFHFIHRRKRQLRNCYVLKQTQEKRPLKTVRPWMKPFLQICKNTFPQSLGCQLGCTNHKVKICPLPNRLHL